MRLDQTVDFRSHQLLCRPLRDLRHLLRRQILQRMIDLPFQIKIVTVLEMNLFPKRFLQRRHVPDIRFRPPAPSGRIAYHNPFPVIQPFFIFKGVDQRNLFRFQILQNPSAHLGPALADNEKKRPRRHNSHIVVQNGRFRFHRPSENQFDVLVAQKRSVDEQIGLAIAGGRRRIPKLLRAPADSSASAADYGNSIRTAVSSQ